MISSLFVRLDNLTKREWVTIPNNKQLCGSAWLIDLMRTISEFISQVSINLIQPLALVGKIIPCVFKINGWWWEEKTSTNEMMLMGSSLKSEKHDGINFKNSKYKMTRFFDKQGYWGYANDKLVLITSNGNKGLIAWTYFVTSCVHEHIFPYVHEWEDAKWSVGQPKVYGCINITVSNLQF